MISEIIEAISVALDAEFCSGYEIHMEKMEQGFQEPCFFIQCVNPADEPVRGSKHFRRNSFCIQFFPSSGSDQNRECYDVAERMNACLEYIRPGRPLRGTGKNSRMVDGILNFFVNYNCMVRREDAGSPEMDGFTPHTAVKEGK